MPDNHAARWNCIQLYSYLIMTDTEQLEQESKLYPWLDDSFMACDEMIGLDFFDEANLFDELKEE